MCLRFGRAVFCRNGVFRVLYNFALWYWRMVHRIALQSWVEAQEERRNRGTAPYVVVATVGRILFISDQAGLPNTYTHKRRLLHTWTYTVVASSHKDCGGVVVRIKGNGHAGQNEYLSTQHNLLSCKSKREVLYRSAEWRLISAASLVAVFYVLFYVVQQQLHVGPRYKRISGYGWNFNITPHKPQ